MNPLPSATSFEEFDGDSVNGRPAHPSDDGSGLCAAPEAVGTFPDSSGGEILVGDLKKAGDGGLAAYRVGGVKGAKGCVFLPLACEPMAVLGLRPFAPRFTHTALGESEHAPPSPPGQRLCNRRARAKGRPACVWWFLPEKGFSVALDESIMGGRCCQVLTCTEAPLGMGCISFQPASRSTGRSGLDNNDRP